MGKIKNIDKFDGKFFGQISQYGDHVNPQSRILLETTYEAIIDSGLFTYEPSPLDIKVFGCRSVYR